MLADGTGAQRAWNDAKRIFTEALEEPENQRPAFVERACGGDEELRREVLSLLESHQQAQGFWETLPLPLKDAPVPDPRYGAYRVLRKLGSGGMGDVYLAERADDQFRKLVALKAIRAELMDEDALRRFQNERQTLAVLSHPNIISLLDAGTSPGGVPFLVTEYVEGETLERFCQNQQLDVRERLRLFREVLEAVHYAHQNLVIHRDLKPANILVTPAGVPKLLDFGVAKLLRPEFAPHMGLTVTQWQPMTLDYASPEQIRGEHATTATDIYSLGVILYRLLTGRHPYELKNGTRMEVEHAICETNPERPSRAMAREVGESHPEPRRIGNDLDNIVLMALRKEPHRRYASAQHFSEDIRRYLEGFPVLARNSSFWYAGYKFLGRHRFSTTAAGVLLVIAGASGVVAWTQKRAAERRFDDLRSFANFVINDLDSALKQGPTPARAALVTKGLEYLDRLAAEQPTPALRRDLVTGYLRIGEVQGNLYAASLGETAQAAASFRKALTIATGLDQEFPASGDDQRRLQQVHVKLGQVLSGTGQRQEAVSHYDAALRISQQLQAQHPAYQTPPVETQVEDLRLWLSVGSNQQNLFDPAGAAESFRFALQIAQKLPDTFPGKTNSIALAREQAAMAAAEAGQLTGAEEQIQLSITAYEKSIAAKPRPGLRRTLAKAYKNLAQVQRLRGRWPEAIQSIQHSLALTEALVAEDPQNEQTRIDRTQALLQAVQLLLAAKHPAEARDLTRRAVALIQPLVEQANPALQEMTDYAELLATTPFQEFQQPALALRLAEQAVNQTHSLDPNALHVLALALRATGDRDHAQRIDRDALALLPATKPGMPPSVFRQQLAPGAPTH